MASRKIVMQNSKATAAYGQLADFPSLSSGSSSSSGSMIRVKTRPLADIYKQTEEIEEILRSITPVSPPSYKEVTEKSLLSKGLISPIPMMSFHSNSSGNSSPSSPRGVGDINLAGDSEVMPVMMADTHSLEDQVAALTKAMEVMMNSMKERDRRMDNVISRLENKESEKTSAEENSQAHKGKTVLNVEDSLGVIYASADKPIPAKTLQELIKEALKDQLEGSSSASSAYYKPYSRRIEGLSMPLNYQPPYFQQFDGKGNPRQHVAHFVETCNNAGTDGDLMVK